ncbi:MAG: hypothetical protein ACU85E_16515 [Gammaproteobacteria bacterium]
MTRIIITLIVLMSVCKTLNASTINYDVTSLGGNSWEYSYTVNNDMLSVDIEEFSIFFDVGLYENLSIGSTPADWDPLVIQPDPSLSEDGFYDVLALVSGIAPGASLDGFSVVFDYLGTGTPGSQSFDIVDPAAFEVLDSGNTTRIGQSVPEPVTLWLLLVGIIGWEILCYAKYGTTAWVTTKKGTPLQRFDAKHLRRDEK